MIEAMRRCHKCGHQLDDAVEVHRSTTCPSCDADLRCCLNCEFYSKGSHWDCRETIDEQVRDKDRANFCGFFRYRTAAAGSGPDDGTSRHDSSRDAFDSLFRD